MIVRKGFIFIDTQMRYARFDLKHSPYGPTETIIVWVSDINEASVVPHENIVRRKYSDLLGNARAIKAVTKQCVELNDWEG